MESKTMKIDLRALGVAIETLERHKDLLQAAIRDLSYNGDFLTIVQMALEHVVIDGFRSDETRGGS
jgi:hypothetical protein